MPGTTPRRLLGPLAGLSLAVGLYGCGGNTSDEADAPAPDAVAQDIEAPSTAAEPEPRDTTPYERFLYEQHAIALGEAERLGEMIDGLNAKEPGLGDFTAGILSIDLDVLADPELGLEAVERRRRQFLETPTTSHDTAGLDHLASRRYDHAVTAFARSALEAGGRGLPYLFIGIAHLERGDWERAAEALSRAVDDPHCEPTAGLLHGWATACVADPPADNAEAGLRYAEVFFEQGGLPPMDAAVLFTTSFHFNESAALAWAEGTLFNLRHERVAELLDAYDTTDDPRLAEQVAYGLVPREVPDTRLADLARRFSDDPPLALAAEWAEYMAMDAPVLEQAWLHAQAAVERAAEQDPGNGAYAFMSVFPFEVVDRSVYDDFELWEEDPDYDPGRPLTEHEVAALRRAAEAERFVMPGSHLRGQALALRDGLYGGFTRRVDVNPGVSHLSKVRGVARRFPNTFRQLAEADRRDECLALSEAIITIADRCGGDRLMARLVANSVQALVAQTWGQWAQATQNRGFADDAVELYLETWRMTGASGDLSMAMLVAEVLPVSRLRSATDALVLRLGEGPGSPGYDAYLLGLRHDADDTPEEMLEQLGRLVNDPEGGRHAVGDYHQRAIVKLADLRNPLALPALRELALGEDVGLFTSALARWAIQRIEGSD